MTISSTTTSKSYTGNGVTTAFPTTFPFFGEDEIEVIERVVATGVETTKALTTHYTVTGGAGSTGTVNAVSAPASTVEWHIRRKTNRLQETDYTANDPFPADTHELALDRAAARDQEIDADLARTPKFPKTDPSSSIGDFPNSVTRANGGLGSVASYDGTGKPSIAAGGATVPVSAAMAPVIAAATLAAAMALLGDSILTARGDLLLRGASTVSRLPLGAKGTLPQSDGTDAAWGYWPGSPSAFRLSLTSGTAVTTSDVTAAGAIYMTPYIGNWIFLPDGTGLARYTTAELTLTLNNALGSFPSGYNFDVFCFLYNGTPTLAAWYWSGGSATSRGTGTNTPELERQNGVWVNKNQTVADNNGVSYTIAAGRGLYLGTFRSTAIAQTEDSKTKRFLWNCYNRRPRRMLVEDATASWNYTTATVRQANANTANQLDFVRGLDEDLVRARLTVFVSNSSAGVSFYSGIGLSSTTAFVGHAQHGGTTLVAGVGQLAITEYCDLPGIGRRFLSWNEYSAASGTTTWLAGSGGGINLQGLLWA